jgi:uncharacterized repeat protein (TIGR02543 family)
MKKSLFTLVFLLTTCILLYSCSTEEEDTTPLQTVLQLTPEPEPIQYTLTVTTEEGGSVSTEGGTYEKGTEVTITATSEEGYIFKGWEGAESENNTITISIENDTSITAIFEAITEYTVSIINSEGGTVSSEGGTFFEGFQFSITATPNEGYEFLGWENNDSISPSLTITITSNITLTAIFSQISDETNSPNIEVGTTTPTLWRGDSITFNKPDETDPNSEEYQDRISESVWITRGNNGGQIFNIAINTNADKTESPVGTEWAIGTLDELDDLEFDYFRNSVSKPKNVVGKNLVLHLVEDDVYLSLKFTSWSSGKKGGFSYERSTP